MAPTESNVYVVDLGQLRLPEREANRLEQDIRHLVQTRLAELDLAPRPVALKDPLGIRTRGYIYRPLE